MTTFAKDSPVWICDPDETVYYASAKVLSQSGDTVKVAKDDGTELEVKSTECFMANPPEYDGMEDMTTLLNLSEPAILRNLSFRFGDNGVQYHLIYTYVGNILIAVNPFKRLPIYKPAMMNHYRRCNKNERAPHAYAIADAAYTNMTTWKKNQSITISGESGAGKTETTKIMMSYLTQVGGALGIGALEERIMQANPILEATGNSKTLRNNNSSRFGKFTLMQFNDKFELVGASINQYLLEKSRLVFQAPNERNYHIFYQLLKGADDKMKMDYKLTGTTPEDFHYLDQSGCTEIAGVSDGAEFQDTYNSMKTCGFDDSQRETCWRMWAALLHIGNIKFKDEGGASVVVDRSPLEHAAMLLKVDQKFLETCVTKYRVKVVGDWVEKERKPEESASSRDALAKAIYARIFVYLVDQINIALANFKDQVYFCGVLDIFGFENFEHGNSFEQLCINLANEKLQQFFNQFVFKLEQQLYKEEELKIDEIPFEDNQGCLDLLENKGGILSMLDEECVVPNGSDKNYHEKCCSTYDKKNKYFAKPKPGGKKVGSLVTFNIVHYAGTVTYDLVGWMEKNNDTLHPDFATLLTGSQDAFVADMFTEKEDPAAAKPKPGGKKTSKFKSVAGAFKTSLTSLMEKLGSSQPHFVRCIKPNPEKTSLRIDNKSTSEQLRSGGVLEAVKIQIAGWPVRMPHEEFVKRYKTLKPKVVNKDWKDSVLQLLTALEYDPKRFAIGKTKVFFRNQGLDVLEDQLAHVTANAAMKIQATWKMFSTRRRVRKLKGNLLKLAFTTKGRVARYRFSRQRAAAIKIQKIFRGHKALARFKQQKLGTLNIQAYARAYQLRRKLTEMKKMGAAAAAEAMAKASEEARKAAEAAEAEEAEASAKTRAAAAAAAGPPEDEDDEAREKREAAEKAAREQAKAAADLKSLEEDTGGMAEMTGNVSSDTKNMISTLRKKCAKRFKVEKVLQAQKTRMTECMDAAHVDMEGQSTLAGTSVTADLKSGYLDKTPKENYSSAKRRWFVLKGDRMYYYKQMTNLNENVPLGTIDLSGFVKVKSPPKADVDSGKVPFDVYGPRKIFHLWADSKEEKDAWVKAIQGRNGVGGEDAPVDAAIIKKGMLDKTQDSSGMMLKLQARSRMFVLKGSSLYYYKTPDDFEKGIAIDSLPLEGCETNKLKNKMGNKPGFEVILAHRKYFLWGENDADVDSWIEAIKASLNKAAQRKATRATMAGGQRPDIKLKSQAATVGFASVEEFDQKEAAAANKLDFVKLAFKEEMKAAAVTVGKVEEIHKMQLALKKALYVRKEGWLTKVSVKDARMSEWQPRYFILKDTTLYYFKTKDAEKHQGTINLDGAIVKVLDGSFNVMLDVSKKFCFSITMENQPTKLYVLVAESAGDMADWVAALETAANDPEDDEFIKMTEVPNIDKPLERLAQKKEADQLHDLGEFIRHSMENDQDVMKQIKRISGETTRMSNKLFAAPTTLEEALGASVQSLVNPAKEGMLMKTPALVGIDKKWSPRYVVLKQDYIYYFKSSKDSAPAGVIPLDGASVSEVQMGEDESLAYVFEVATKGAQGAQGRSFYLKATSNDDRSHWISMVQQNIADCSDAHQKMNKSKKSKNMEDALRKGDWKSSPDLDGMLKKQGNHDYNAAKYSERYVILKGNSVYYLKTKDDETPAGVVLLDDATVTASDRTELEFEIRTPGRTYFFQASAPNECKKWVDAIERNMKEQGHKVNAGLMNSLVLPRKSGYLTKQGAFVKTWKRRWFVLENAMLFYFVNPDEYPLKPKGSIPLTHDVEIEMDPRDDQLDAKNLAIQIVQPQLDSYMIVPDNEVEKMEWAKALRQSVQCLKQLEDRKQEFHEGHEEHGADGGLSDDDDELGGGGPVNDLDDEAGTNSYMRVRKMGYLLKMTPTSIGIHRWVKRLFILKNGFLLSYTPKDSEIYPEELIPMRRSSVFNAEPITKRKNTFEIRNSCLQNTVYCLECTSREDLQDWMDAINDTAHQFQEEERAINERRSTERNAAVENDKQDSGDNKWFCIEANWLRAWRDFTSEGSSAPPPGPVANSDLASPDGKPKGKWERTVHYKLINQANWELFNKSYGGGPELPREDFERKIAVFKAGKAGAAFGGGMAINVPPPPPPGSLLGHAASFRQETSDDVTSEKHEKSGWLWKAKDHSSTFGWKKRWVVLKDQKLVYRESPTEKDLGTITFESATVKPSEEQTCVKPNGFDIILPGRPYFFAACSDDAGEGKKEMQEWIKVLEAVKFQVGFSRAQHSDSVDGLPITGIGVVLRHETSDGPTIESILEGGPTDRYQDRHGGKIKVGDRILEVGGSSTIGLDFSAILDMVRGRVNTHVELLVQRGESTEPFDHETQLGQFVAELIRTEVRKTDIYNKSNTMQGYLWKATSKSGIMATMSMKKRWFVLTSNVLQYFKKPSDSSAVDSIPLPIYGNDAAGQGEMSVKPLEDLDGKFGFELHLEHRDYYLWAETKEDKEKWVEAFQPAN